MRQRLLAVGAIAVFLILVVLAASARGQIVGPIGPRGPTASFTYSPSAPMPGDIITFDASGSYAPSGTIMSYTWDFGDGTVATVASPTITHSYIIDGTYTVQLTVVDNNGAQGAATAVIDVSTQVFFRVVFSGTLIPISSATVTAYVNFGSGWVTAPVGRSGFEIEYDNMTQPNLATTSAQKYRNPGYTASILYQNASNIGFDVHPSCWTVYFKFQWGPWTAYWPNDTTTVYSYKNGAVETHNYDHDEGAYWDPTASTYVIQVEDIPHDGVWPSGSHPIIVGILCPPPPQQYYLTVNTNPSGITTIPGQGWYNQGTNVTLTAPTYVNVSSSTRYRFNYWDVGGTSQGAGVNPITVTMNANHTATAHYVTQYSVIFNQTGLSADATGTIVTVNGNPENYTQLPFTFWADSGGSVNYSYSSIVSSSVSGKQFRLSSVTGPSSPITVSGCMTVTGNYVTQYQVTFAQTGLDSSANGTVVTVNGSAKVYTSLPYTLWVDSGSSVTYSYSSTVSSSTGGKQFRLNTVSGHSSPFIVSGPMTVTGNYIAQYSVTFAQTGLDSTASGTIVTVNGNPQILSTLPYTFWVDNGTSVTYVYGSTITSSVSGKQFRLLSITGQPSPLTVTGTTTITGNYKTQYYLTVTSLYGSPSPASGWLDSGTNVTDSVTSPAAGGSGIQYVCTGWSGTGSVPASGTAPSVTFTITAPSTITWAWKTQYYLTVTSPHDSPSPASGWFDSGAGINASVTSPVSGGSGIQYVCTGWSGSGSVPGSGTASSVSFTIAQPSSITWNWKTQYYLTVSSAHDSPTPLSGWFDSGTGINASVASPVSGGSGIQYVCTGWSGTGSVPASGTASSVTFTIGSPSSVTWAWKTQYQVTFGQSGVGSDFLGTVVSVDSVNYNVSSLTVSFWWDSGSNHSFSFASPLVVGSKQYSWNSTSGLSTLQNGTLSIAASGSVVGNYVIQNQVTFAQVGVSSDFTGTVVIIDSTSYSKTQLPVSFLWSIGSNHSFAFQSPLIVGASTEQYVWTSTTGLSSLQNGSITVAAYGSIIGNYKTQYYLTVFSPYDSPSPLSGWFDSGANVTDSVSSPVSGGSGIQYVCTGWSGTGSVPASGSGTSVTFAISAPSTITWTWKTQYYLTVSSAYDSPSGQGWYDAGSMANFSVTTPVSGGAGTQYVFTAWSSSDSGGYTGSSVSQSVTMNNPITETASWKTQYYFTVSSPCDSPSPLSGWFDSGTSINASVASPVSGGSGTQYVCTGWSGTGSVPPSGAASSVTFTITAPSTITWAWKTQYAVTFGHSGLDSSSSGTVATVNGTPISYGQLPYTMWADSGDSITYSYNNVSSSTPGKTFVLIGVTGLPSPITVTSPMTVTGNYKTQYEVTFNQTGVGSDFSGTIVRIDGTDYNYGALSSSFWWDNGSSHTFSFYSPLVVNISKQYDWASTSGLSTLQNDTLFISGSGSVTGNYGVENKVQITFSQTGVNTDFTGTVVTIDGVNYTVTALPLPFWWDTNSIHTFTYQSPLIVTPNAQQYVWTSTSGLSTLQNDTITATTSGNITGNYKTQYYLILTTEPSGVNSPSGAGWYDANTNATISTTAFVDIVPGCSRYRFNGWTTADMTEIADPTRSPTTVLIDEAKTVTANYAAQYVVVFKQSGVGSDFTGTVVAIDTINYNFTSLPATFFWDNGTTHSFDFQSPLTVTPNAKSYVWTSTSGLSTQQSDPIVVMSFGNITGNYETQYYLTVAISPPGITTILGQGWYNDSATVTLTAPPVSNYSFAYWLVNGVSQGAGVNPITLTMNAAQNATAQYTPIAPYTLIIVAMPGGTTNPPPGTYTYSSGTTVMITAIPNSGYVLNHWELFSTDISSMVNPILVTMNMNHTLNAIFSPAPQPPTVNISPPDSTIDLGGSVLFTSSVSGGTAPYSYQWYLNGAPVSGATSVSWTFFPTSMGMDFVSLKVTDANNNTAYSDPAKVTVIPPPVGGYSVSLANHEASIQMACYTSLISLFAAAIIVFKRKRK